MDNGCRHAGLVEGLQMWCLAMYLWMICIGVRFFTLEAVFDRFADAGFHSCAGGVKYDQLAQNQCK
jgi:hypothetical protein